MLQTTMARSEKYAAAILTSVYSTRMFSLFIILPVFSLYGSHYQGATIVLVGLALGIHGLTQALFQLPLGALSDRIGRKRVIIGGLILFCVGGVIAASADSIYQVIVGRALQGAGAISSALTAFAADLSRDSQRSKMMAIIGIGIGASFILALLLAPPLHQYLGLTGLFGIAVVLGVLAIALVAALPSTQPAHTQIPSIRQAFASPELIRLYAGVFFLHTVMSSNFMLLPQALVSRMGISGNDHWLFYLPIFIVSFAVMFPILIVGEKKARVKQFFLLSVALTIVGQICWQWFTNEWLFVIGILLFFIGFNYLEANLPALVTRFCDKRIRGSAMGVFSTMQFAGIFVGAFGAGVVIEHLGTEYITLFAVVLLAAWYLIAARMRNIAPASYLP